VERARGASRGIPIEIECETLEHVRAAIGARADEVLLDNMSVEMIAVAVVLCRDAGVRTEASGGVTLDTIAEVASTGVDSISIGALTHSAAAIDLSLEVEAS
jgi:nicotinate-nucleotide pyrophosphorylase